MTNLVQIIAAIITVESGGNDLVVGDGGRAIGALQIHAGVVADVNRRYGTHYTHAGMTNRVAAIEVFHRYQAMYVKVWSVENCARTWNGGPQGNKKPSTLLYYKKVLKVYKPAR